jgi:hypothetical protein
MASKIDKLRLEHATALVKQRTAETELHARRLQLLTAGVTFATAGVSVSGGLLVILGLH